MQKPNQDEVVKLFPQLQNLKHVDNGGSKYVYKADHPTWGTVALLLMDESTNFDRIKREIQILSRGTIPCVPKLYEYGNKTAQDQEYTFFIEPFIAGDSLADYLNKNNGLSLFRALDLLEWLLETAVKLEKEELVHRDIKPGNIKIESNNKFWLLDFGIARELNTESITSTNLAYGPGTYGYAAPEQIRNIKNSICSRTDLFSIGVVFYEALTKTQPFIAGNPPNGERIRRTLMDELPLINIIEDQKGYLKLFVDSLVKKKVSERPPSAKKALSYFLEKVRPSIY